MVGIGLQPHLEIVPAVCALLLGSVLCTVVDSHPSNHPFPFALAVPLFCFATAAILCYYWLGVSVNVAELVT